MSVGNVILLLLAHDVLLVAAVVLWALYRMATWHLR